MEILSLQSYLNEAAYISDNTPDAVDAIDKINTLLEDTSDMTYNKVTQHLRLEILDVERFVKVNECKCVSDPRPFLRDNIASPEGYCLMKYLVLLGKRELELMHI